jgi:phage virion morphogenesis protein
MGVVNLKVAPMSAAGITQSLQRTIDRTHNLYPLMADIGQYMVRSTQNRILREKKSPKGDRWAELAQSTIDSKGHSSILFLTGDLAKGISVEDVSNTNVTIRSDSEYGSFHQKGWKHHGRPGRTKRVPARPFLGVSEENKRRIKKMLRDYLQR